MATSRTYVDQIIKELLGQGTAPQGFQFSPDFANRFTGYDEQFAQLDSDQEFGRRGIEDEYSNFGQRLQKQQGVDLDQLQTRMADQGILRSGINVGEQGKINENFTNAMNQLASSKGRDVEGLVRDFAGRRSGLQGQLMSDIRGQAQSELEKALEKARLESEAKAAKQAQEENARQLAEMRAQIEAQNAARAAQPVMSPTGQYGATPGFQAPMNLGDWINQKAPVETDTQGNLVNYDALVSMLGQLGINPTAVTNLDPNAILQSLGGQYGGAEVPITNIHELYQALNRRLMGRQQGGAY